MGHSTTPEDKKRKKGNLATKADNYITTCIRIEW
jgi:hypothetical protein